MLSLLPLLAALPLQGDPQPNIVMILADDFGVDMVSAYGEAPNPPCTPNIDGLASTGMLFRNAWANPVCSPTRAALLTGRYGFRNGIGDVVLGQGLSLGELTIPEMLSGYASAAVGKWHLAGGAGGGGGGGGGNPMHPNITGFDSFAGILGGGVGDYFSWPKVVNGQTSTTTTYTTTDQVNEAIAAMSSMPEPWFLYLSFNAPHVPFHEPPPALCPPTGCPAFLCSNPSPSAPNSVLNKAMVAAMDTELGRFLGALDSEDPDAYVFFMGDNGTAPMASQSPFESDHAKGQLYEGGVNVPLIVRGPGVQNAESAALVSITDMFATFAELAGLPSNAEDSVSFVPTLGDAGVAVRHTVYSEKFSPNNGSFPPATHEYALRDERYKLKRATGQADEFYDLLTDPFELTNLLPNLGAAEQAIHDELAAEVLALHEGDALAGFPAQISVSTGGSQALALSAGSAHAGGIHLVVGSLSGTSPGTQLGALNLPLNVDAYTQVSLLNANGAIFDNTLGVLDSLGTANAAIRYLIALDPALIGTLVDHAFVVLGPLGNVSFASNPTSILLAP